MSSADNRSGIDDFDNKLKATSEYNEMLGLLSPIVQLIEKSDYARKILKPCVAKLIARSELQQKRALLLKERLKAVPTHETETLEKALFYMGFFEIAITNIVDQLILMLVAIHHDFYVYLSRDYAKQLEDLDNASLAEKLAFLKRHGFDFPVVNRKLRNSIAHMDFEPLPNGKIRIDSEEYDLTHEILLVSAFVILIGTALIEAGFPETMKKVAR